MNSKRGTKGAKARAGEQEYKDNKSGTKAQEQEADESNNEARPHSAKEYEKDNLAAKLPMVVTKANYTTVISHRKIKKSSGN